MPYVKKLKNRISLEDRAVLDPLICPLVGRMRQVKGPEDVTSLLPLVDALADGIKSLDKKYAYFGAFAGELNYSITSIMLDLLPDVRYWVAALTTGWQERTKHNFLVHAPACIEETYLEKKPAGMPFGTDRMFKYLSEWVAVVLSCRVLPDHTADSIDAVVGVFSHLDTEMYRRIWAPYEEQAIRTNGDLPQYKKWIGKIQKGKK
jgi:hypothetical protein